MSLKKYQRLRKFSQTPEPKAARISKSKQSPIFVVQKHAARNLHYDLRLEMNGVLKSWAVPKGPSMNPTDKRLAMMVEDHPLDYKDFEGLIPEGNYGAGEVIIWDKGTYSPRNPAKSPSESIKEGHITFILKGEKLKGEYALIHLPRAREKNAWLLIKANDKFASHEDILKKDRSVVSGKKIDGIKKETP